MTARRWLVATAILVAACTADGDSPTSTAEQESSPPPTTEPVLGEDPDPGPPPDPDAGGFAFDEDGTIVFFSDRSGNLDIWQLDPVEGDVTQLSTEPSSEYEPDWAPDRSAILYSSDRVNTAADLFIVSTADGEVVQLTNTPDTVDDYANYSPDGSLVVFQRTFLNRTPVTAEIFIIDVGTGAERQITDNEYWDSTPSFTPDGESIIFESNRTGNFEIWRVSLDGTGPAQLTNSPVGTVNSEAVYSSDGSHIVYTTVPPGGNGDLALITPDVDHPILLTEGPDDDGHGEFSPDGETIAFYRNGDIHLMDADGQNIRQITSGPAEDLDPHWH